MDDDRARTLLQNQREQVQRLLGETSAAGQDDREAEQETGDYADPGPALAAEGVDDAVAASLRERLAAIERAEQRLADGTYGRSIKSGTPIPNERLEFDPAAELTVEEAAEAQ
jgi:DnaK suppressor protein